jgi:hypothetical protein
VIGHVAYFVAAVWFTWWDSKLLYVAATRRYVMARRELFDPTEYPITPEEDRQKFWSNVIIALLLLPVAFAGLYFSSTELYAALRG